MLKWLAARRRRKQDEALDAAGASVRRLFPEAIAFVAQQWTGMVDHMMHVSADDWRARSLETRILVFTDMSAGLRDLPARFDAVRSKIADAVAAGIDEDDARQQIQAGILAEALVATGEDRRDVTAILFPS
jgi:hypothetical protein